MAANEDATTTETTGTTTGPTTETTTGAPDNDDPPSGTSSSSSPPAPPVPTAGKMKKEETFESTTTWSTNSNASAKDDIDDDGGGGGGGEKSLPTTSSSAVVDPASSTTTAAATTTTVPSPPDRASASSSPVPPSSQPPHPLSVNSAGDTNNNNNNHKIPPKSKSKKSKGHKHTSSTQIPFIPAASEKRIGGGSTSSVGGGGGSTKSGGDGDNQSQNHQSLEEDDRIRLGICAMDKKARSKPMAEILSRLDEEVFHVVFFGDDVILNQSIEEWPICHVLIAFYSKGYPLDKVLEYVTLRKPFTLNNLQNQKLLMDRRKVYDLLEGSGIDVPRHVYLSQDDYVSTGTGDGDGSRDQEVVEHDDHIEVNGVTIHKPFVEKPVDADDHNIAIYYPTSAGGGCKKLFRKIGNRSSEFYPDINEVRRDGSYIYEEFVETQGTDVKMYTVGPEYGHAEARKSPTVDGKVERNSEGKEVRFPVILTLREKEIARRIVLVFKQFVCGFDLLRVQVKDQVVSYVCDVNGFSFVKNSRKYYDDCAQILMEHILATVKPGASTGFSTLDPLITNVNRIEYGPATNGVPTSIIPTTGAGAGAGAPPTHKRSDTFFSRATRMLQGEPDPDDHGDSGDSDEDDHNKKNKSNNGNSNSNNNNNNTNNTNSSSMEGSERIATTPKRGTSKVHSPARSDASADGILASAAATLVDGAIPVREIPNQLLSEPASMCPSEVSSQAGDLEPPNGHGGGIGGGGGGHRKARSESISLVESHEEELRCVIAVIRHGDRTPKQKLKVNMKEPSILQYFHDHTKDVKQELKVKAKAPMTEFLETVRTTLEELELRNSDKDKNLKQHLRHMRDILERWRIAGMNRKLQLKPKKFEEYIDDNGKKKTRCTQVQLVFKYGGNLTRLGENQALRLGRKLRRDAYPDVSGGGILRLHSTFRHDLKIKTSDEGRVMKTAAAFAKGLLELEGDLPPILVSLVHKEKGSMHMLDPSGNKEVKAELDECKERITANLQKDIDISKASSEEREQLVGPSELTSLHKALKAIGNPRKTLNKIHETMGELIDQLEEMLGMMGSGDEKRIEGGEGLKGDDENDVALSGVKLYKGETLLELTERWRFLYKNLYDSDSDKFDLSRIPDVHDNVRFDVLHNPHLGLSNTLEKLYNLAKNAADCVVPQEYGTTFAEKRSVGVKISKALLEKIKYDLTVARADNEVDMRYMINMAYSTDLPINTMGRRVRTRLYFTSESHLHTMLNVLRFARDRSSVLSEQGINILNGTSELCYLTQIVMRLFEDNRWELSDPRRFRVEILFSPGATATPLHMHEQDRDSDPSRFDTAPLEMIGREGLTCQELEDFFHAAVMEGGIDDEDEEVDPETPTETVKDAKTKEGGIPSEIHTKPVEATNAVVPDQTEVAQPKELENHVNDVEPQGQDAVVMASDNGSTPAAIPDSVQNDSGDNDESQDDDSSKTIRDLERKFFWSTVAVGTAMLAASCLVLAWSFKGEPRHARRYSTKRY